MIEAKQFPLRQDIQFYGRCTFVPIQVYNVRLRYFDGNWLAGYPLFDIEALRGCVFPYVFSKDAEFQEVVKEEELVSNATEHEGYVASGKMPREMKNGDLLLASRQHPTRFSELK
jgi:hypothetical protein